MWQAELKRQWADAEAKSMAVVKRLKADTAAKRQAVV
jgi:hypothetical protein